MMVIKDKTSITTKLVSVGEISGVVDVSEVVVVVVTT